MNAMRTISNEVGPELDASVGFDFMRTWQAERKDCFTGLCDHDDCHRRFARRSRQAQREDQRIVLGDFPETVPLCEDGSIDKVALRLYRVANSRPAGAGRTTARVRSAARAR